MDAQKMTEGDFVTSPQYNGLVSRRQKLNYFFAQHTLHLFEFPFGTDQIACIIQANAFRIMVKRKIAQRLAYGGGAFGGAGTTLIPSDAFVAAKTKERKARVAGSGLFNISGEIKGPHHVMPSPGVIVLKRVIASFPS
jgi:hypothetical protein